ncbi:ribonuclease Z [Alicyclobacillus contaminans]|uniref:ribonuclease Z n=1 Tax=Alicyclobacillus contaminans TaxID=392016 RepID=UPI000687BB8B|nr:ribonuclease Z [Alicyclobacillus contaminans]
MELLFLGTGAGLPMKRRNVAGMVLRMPAERRADWLFDCGEGTQHQLLRTSVSLHRLEHVFITHLHGDHLYGLPGILTSRSAQGATSSLRVFGPPGLRTYIQSVLSASCAHLTYPLHIQEVQPGAVFADDQITVTCDQLDHTVPSYGYRVTERDLPGKLDRVRLQQQGIPPGPVYGRLKRGEDVTLADGRTLHANDYVFASRKGRTVVVLGDTRPTSRAINLARGANVLVHEATFASEHQQLAHRYGHSTAVEAARTAAEAGVDILVLTHISARYADDASRLLSEAQSIHPRTYLAEDFWNLSVDVRSGSVESSPPHPGRE